MEIRVADAGRGAGWLGDGFDYFKRDAGMWIGITVVVFVIYFVLAWIPIIGTVATQLLAPVFSAGVLLGCKSMDDGGALELGHLFKGFSGNPGPFDCHRRAESGGHDRARNSHADTWVHSARWRGHNYQNG